MTTAVAPVVGPAKTAASRPVEPEDLETLPEDHGYELVDGELVVEEPMGVKAVKTATLLSAALVTWSHHADPTQEKGSVLVECYIQCFAWQKKMVRRPDVAFVSRHRLAPADVPDGHLMVAPELAVEVISPTDNIYELERKIADYFRADVKQVWTVNPDQRLIRIHRPSGDLTELRGDGEIVGDDDMLPGFRCSLDAIFGPAVQASDAA